MSNEAVSRLFLALAIIMVGAFIAHVTLAGAGPYARKYVYHGTEYDVQLVFDRKDASYFIANVTSGGKVSAKIIDRQYALENNLIWKTGNSIRRYGFDAKAITEEVLGFR